MTPRCPVCALPLTPLFTPPVVVTSDTPETGPWQCRTNWCARTYWLPLEGR